MQPACLRIKGGSSAKPSAVKGAGKGGPAAGGLKEEQLKRMLGQICPWPLCTRVRVFPYRPYAD
jgi:hypothetical protein